MPVPEGYLTKNGAFEYVRERTGYGRLAIEHKMDDLLAIGEIRFIDHPGHRQAKLISKQDVEKVVAGLTLLPPP